MDELTRLGADTLQLLGAPVLVPQYDRTALNPGIVHIGVGNFHRAHQAWYLHRLMARGLAHDWAIVGAGVRAQDAQMRQKLLAQDCLTTLIELDPDSTAVEIVGSMIGYVPVADGHDALIRQIADPATRIVSLTITEGGYYRGPDGFDARHPDILRDTLDPDRPTTAFGAIVAALARRRTQGLGPLTVLSCDNIQGNGDIVRDTIVSLADLTEPGLASWIGDECSFPNSMVDCIVPATGPAELALVRAQGIDDAAPVTHEPFRQWVIEDKFCAGRPEWERVGATLTGDVHLYETMKLRILNGGHQMVANAGDLLGIETIAEATTHPEISALLHHVQTREVLPHVREVPGTTPTAYLDLIVQRFSNPRIADTTRRVAFDGSSRHAGFILPTIRDRIAAGAPVQGLALIEALWARYCQGSREDGSPIAPNDPHWETLLRRAERARQEPAHWLRDNDMYADIVDDLGFLSSFGDHLDRIGRVGVLGAIRHYLARSS